jgi:Ca-activated chloride channel homolog
VRVYTVGIDTAVNEGFLRRLAGLGGGACELVESEDRLDAVMDRVHRRIGTPVVTDLELVASGFDADPDSVAPRRLPALFAGAPLVVCGRFRGEPGGALTVRGRDAAGQPWSATVPATVGGTPALATMWARAHLRDLEDRYATDPAPDRDLERRIVETSLRFGVLCRFTAFVAADVQVVNEGGTVHRVLQPVDAPAGWDMFNRVEQAVAAMPMASMAPLSMGGLQAEGMPSLGTARRRVATGPLGRRPRSGGFAGEPLSGAALAPYRHRAGELARLLDRDRPELERRLGLVRVGLQALIADLESVDAAEAELRPLRELAAQLDHGLAGPAIADTGALERLRERAAAVLEAFAAVAGDPGTMPTLAPERPRDRAFWKR